MAAPESGPGHRLGSEVVGATTDPFGHETSHHLAPLGIADGGMGHQGRNRTGEADPDAQFVELTGAEPVGVDDRLAEHVHHGLVLGCTSQLTVETGELGVELAPYDLPLRLVVAEEGPAADPYGGGDLVHRGVVVTLAGEEIEGGPSHRLAGGGRPTSPSPRRSGPAPSATGTVIRLPF